MLILTFSIVALIAEINLRLSIHLTHLLGSVPNNQTRFYKHDIYFLLEIKNVILKLLVK